MLKIGNDGFIGTAFVISTASQTNYLYRIDGVI